ncbi:hypothetical protein CCP3SC15_480001 [Gammaproteobacteria bacterium]
MQSQAADEAGAFVITIGMGVFVKVREGITVSVGVQVRVGVLVEVDVGSAWKVSVGARRAWAVAVALYSGVLVWIKPMMQQMTISPMAARMRYAFHFGFLDGGNCPK